jgi:hypothetical protein
MRRSNFLWISLSCCLASAAAYAAPGALDAAAAKAGLARAPLKVGDIVTFKNLKSGRCIGVEHAKTFNGALVKQGTCRRDAVDQKWLLKKGSTPDTFSLMNMHSRRCMGVDGAKVTQGANIGQYDCHPSDGVSNQHWEIYGDSLKVAILVNEKSSYAHDQGRVPYCVGVEHGQIGRAQLKQAPCFHEPAHLDQGWEVDRRG